MTPLDKIERLWDAAIASIDSKEYPNIVAVLNARLPAVLEHLADLAIADAVSPTTRFKAAELLTRVLTTLAQTSSKANESAVDIEQAKARRESAKARAKRLELELKSADRAATKRAAATSRKLAAALLKVEEITR